MVEHMLSIHLELAGFHPVGGGGGGGGGGKLPPPNIPASPPKMREGKGRET